ncbi:MULTISPECIES: HAD family hydrolase [Catenuloplanes]|uniref:2-haloacid dehalogenase/putative hydrolase of the HAD superfamily n=1 Tax=Catenuloplanes niger TaxID=587534 RepID=A0AAE4CSK0_9ACTN|nr:HAD family hydrolase [Catenuloplanes niger]MDR7319829.1 2-haloacid dehalogenase/putative hydrolase of the HAD superfamily [Catenuloplanes niger]
MIRGLLLDFYGTVVEDDDEVMAAIAARVAAGATRPVTPEQVLGAWSRAYQAAADRVPFRPLRDCARDGLAAAMTEAGCAGDATELCAPQFAFWRAPPLRPGTREFLAALTVPVCVVSDADRSDLDAAIRRHGLEVAAVVCSEEVGAYKPDRAMFAAGLAALGLTADQVWHVGDSPATDVAGAVAAGIPVAWVNRHGRTAPAGTPPAAEVTGLAGLIGRLPQAPRPRWRGLAARLQNSHNSSTVPSGSWCIQ